MKLIFGVVVMAVSVCSCTNKQVYESVQNGNRLECDKLQTVQRDECLKRLGPSYNQYEDERKKLLKK